MLRRIANSVTLLVIAAANFTAFAETARTFTPRKIDNAELRYIGDVPIAILSGTPEQIGRQHAILMKEAIPGALALPKRFADELGVGVLWPLVTQAGKTLMLNAPQRDQQELAAMAEQSGVDAGTIAVANTLLELRRMGCSTLIVEPSRSATGGPLLGRNFDFPTLGELHQYSLLSIYRPEGRRPFASIGFPGLVGVFSGMNDAGLAVATLDVEQSADGSPKFESKGTPLAMVFRRILEECATVDEAEKLLKSEKATTWMNLSVCDRDRGAVFEITPKNIARRNGESGFVRCTNHFRTPGLSTGETCWRYDALMKTDDPDAPVDVAVVQKALNAANQGDMTLQTMVFETRTLVLHLAIGTPPTSEKPMTRIELAPLLKPAASNAGK